MFLSSRVSPDLRSFTGIISSKVWKGARSAATESKPLTGAVLFSASDDQRTVNWVTVAVLWYGCSVDSPLSQTRLLGDAVNAGAAELTLARLAASTALA